ncbi:MAG: hypothetical protein JXR25_01200 [Pontiellaceae bacterium]|nr:hypothetical protein [Pontiellaceae bacterium]MBN2783416.1 hypothetical protein [Pontiellaceae bacterium]
MPRPNKHIIYYLISWAAYIFFVYWMFPVFNITVMEASIALSMFGAWLFGYSGAIFTTLITIPFHYVMLRHFSDTPALWNEAFNPFGISSQIFISFLIALLRHTRIKLENLNIALEEKVSQRTEELNRIQNYVVRNNESAQVMLSHMLLNDIGASLKGLQSDCDRFLNKLVFKSNSVTHQTAKLNDMIRRSTLMIETLGFMDHFFKTEGYDYTDALNDVMRHMKESTKTDFIVRIEPESKKIPLHIQHQLYRITQEAITNAVRHGKASKVSIELSIKDGRYDLSVINDGTPMPPDIEKGLGMRLMQHRTEQLGGTLNLTQHTNGNTLLHCTIPVPEACS